MFLTADAIHKTKVMLNCTTNLAGSRDAPHVSTLPPDVALLAVEEAVPLLQELKSEQDYFLYSQICVPQLYLICDAGIKH